mgnify:CR=1 FL=1
MTFPLVTGGESRELQKAPTGNHVSRCYQVVDLGQQKTTFQGTEKIQRQLQPLGVGYIAAIPSKVAHHFVKPIHTQSGEMIA